MIEINLIPDVKREYLKTRSMRNIVISSSILVAIGVAAICCVMGLILGGQLVAQSLQDNAIKEESGKLTSIEDLNKTVTIQQQLEKIDQQHEAKTITSRLFDVMSAINPPAPNDVRISSLRFNPEDKTIAIEGSAANGYAALEVFKKTIINTKVQVKSGDTTDEIQLADTIVAGETSFGENSEGQRVLRFSFNFAYPDVLFAVAEGSVSVVTPTGKIDVTDSKLGVPSSLFGSSNAKNEEDN